MNKLTKTIVGFLVLSLLFVLACQNNKGEKTDTILEGKASIYVDESILPIVEDAEAVFEVQYRAKLHLVPQSENEVLNSMFKDTAKIAILTRTLTEDELKAFQSKKINPRITPFATDAVAFIRNKKANDTLIVLQDVIDFIKGKSVPGIKGLVFDNANSSTVRFLSEKAGVVISNQKGIFSQKNNEDVIKYVAENEGLVGVIGMNWIFQPPLELQEQVDKVNVLGVKGNDSSEFIFPTQDNLAIGKYPLARHLYIVNCQGYSGLGMGFASFLGGERGQRIILKSGLVPERIPTRKIVVRNKIIKDKN
ncbi:PstS family phosphate ABC transporter substrate-binding protein [Flavobacterium sedimenticola]|uniref:Substrate-binding domain-containing protein n=1 Tax=Flavobacterium sedimenticola TaxID=3043286 RepID=A0ABT6XNF2_9FLAO|nr:substrate-binding domain-containing protein [Flavobacterium sedimenticola]MDI9256614.1 substrate-binding domain-containing protein [Flavobacterium sedimenticola]